MTPVPPPHGMSEVDYATIEAAVTETVRGRWFLNEFARRNRTAELRQLLDAMARIESVVAAPALPPADPSIRLLMQRIKDIAGQLDTVSHQMREAGVDERFTSAVEKEARAVSGMMRGPSLTGANARPAAAPRKADTLIAAPMPVEPAPETTAPPVEAPAPPALQVVEGTAPVEPVAAEPARADPRLARLAGLDRLSLAEKLTLFA